MYGPRDEEEEAELAAALNKWPTGNHYALCVGCGSALCSKCMGSNKYFPNEIELDNVLGRTGFQVKADSTSEYRYFVCHDCIDDKERYVLTAACCSVCMHTALLLYYAHAAG